MNDERAVESSHEKKTQSIIMIFGGGIAAILGVLFLSVELFAFQVFRFFTFNSGFALWSPDRWAGPVRGTTVSDIISVAWIYIAFIVTGIVILAGFIFMYIGIKNKNGKGNKSGIED